MRWLFKSCCSVPVSRVLDQARLLYYKLSRPEHFVEAATTIVITISIGQSLFLVVMG